GGAGNRGGRVGTVRGGWARAGARLRARLARRGLTLTATGIAAVLSEGASAVAVPPALPARTLRAAMSFATRGPVAGAASATALALAKGMLQTTTATRPRYIGALMLAGRARPAAR